MKNNKNSYLIANTLDFFLVMLVSFFVSCSFRLLPLPVGDTARALILSTLAFTLANILGNTKSIFKFFKLCSPILIIIFLSFLIELGLQREGFFTYLVLAKIISLLLIGSVVFSFNIKKIKLLIFLSISLLLIQALIIWKFKNFFTFNMLALGVVDPFISHGAELQRMYFCYLNANAAAYSIFFIFLSSQVIFKFQKKSFLAVVLVALVFLFLISMTQSRGAIGLFVVFCLVYPLIFRATSFFWLVFFTVSIFLAIHLFDSLFEIYLIREESNQARFSALINYFNFIWEDPIWGLGVQNIREAIANENFKPSHNFFIESLVTYGFPLSIAIYYFLVKNLFFRHRLLSVGCVGLFVLLTGLFTNTLLTNWVFLSLLLPVILSTSMSYTPTKTN